MTMSGLNPQDVIRRYQRARERRSGWESLWQECYDYALPSRDTAVRASVQGVRRTDRLFDGTAPDAVDQLAASLMAQLTPPWARWFGFASGPDIEAGERWAVGPELERATTIIQSHFDRSNFAVEMHQCYLDLVTAGIWQADDDGVINPATITLVPGTIIPKAVGSAGLTPLQIPGRFDVSEIVLDQLRSRIRKALFVDFLGQVNSPRMTATEVLERAAEMVRMIDFEAFRPLLEEALAYSDGAKGGRLPYDPVAMFKVMILAAQNNVSDARMEFLIRERLSWLRFLDFDLGKAAPDENTIRQFRERLTGAGAIRRLFEGFDRPLRRAG